MAGLTFGFVGGKHKAGLQQGPGRLCQAAEVLGLQGTRRQVEGEAGQERKVTQGIRQAENT